MQLKINTSLCLFLWNINFWHNKIHWICLPVFPTVLQYRAIPVYSSIILPTLYLSTGFLHQCTQGEGLQSITGHTLRCHVGHGVWFSFRVWEILGSNPGQALWMLWIFLLPHYYSRCLSVTPFILAPRGNSESPVDRNMKVIGLWGKPEYPEKTQSCEGSTCKLHIGNAFCLSSSQTQDVLAVLTTHPQPLTQV